jgi:hypothetical protein
VNAVPEAGIWRDRKFSGFVDVILKSIIKKPGRILYFWIISKLVAVKQEEIG